MKSEIKDKLLKWYESNRRELPWRESKDPYRIWVSEVILQQTRVAYGIEYFNRFTARFPDVRALAEASDDEVMRQWQGLGYYRRAANLQEAARTVMKEYKGVFPTTYAEIAALKGIGSYTAAAICSIAYDLPYAVVDGNVYRILARMFALEAPIDSNSGKRLFAELAQQLLDKEHAGEYNQAMMDFGALQCTPQAPHCENCPFSGECAASLNGTQSLYPIKEKKTKIRNRYFNYIQIVCGDQTFLKKRTAKDIWHNLYEFPMIESDTELDYQMVVESEQFQQMAKGVRSVRLVKSIRMPKHQLSHQSIYATFYETIWSDVPELEELIAIPVSALSAYPVSRLTELYLEHQQ